MIHLIETTDDLEEFCRHLKTQKFITVDLEFLREKTYYAELCLIQVGTPEQAAIIDPMSKKLIMNSFFDILQDPAIVKVFHSGRQDIEILYFLTGKTPFPIFDTQIAAQVCGYGESPSYESLVNSILKLELDKSCRFTNWSSRPLNPKQLEYALSDVTHLVHIYDYFKQELQKSGRESWFQDEINTLCDPQTYYVNPEDAWQKIKHRSHNARFLTVLRELAAWREKRAQLKNTPRQSIIKDDCLLNIAASCPQTPEELAQIRNIRKDVVNGKLAGEILDVLSFCRSIAPENYVTPPKEKSLSHSCSALYELLKLLLKIRSQEEGVVAKLIADDDELKMLASFKDKNNPVLKGWRHDIFGRMAVELRSGRLSISFDPQKKSICLKKTAPEMDGTVVTEDAKSD